VGRAGGSWRDCAQPPVLFVRLYRPRIHSRRGRDSDRGRRFASAGWCPEASWSDRLRAVWLDERRVGRDVPTLRPHALGQVVRSDWTEQSVRGPQLVARLSADRMPTERPLRAGQRADTLTEKPRLTWRARPDQEDDPLERAQNSPASGRTRRMAQEPSQPPQGGAQRFGARS
jgi:hypothetical protein